MKQTGMLSPGARIGVAVSGGVDSFVLLKALVIRQRKLPIPFELMVIHVNPGFDPHSHLPLIEWLRQNNIPAHLEVTDHGPRAHTPENRKNSPCFYCSMLRRKKFFDICAEYGLTHLALGHNTHDLVSTFFMNMLQCGRVDGLRPIQDFFNGELTLIRPLLEVEKEYIRAAGRQWKLPVWKNSCPSAETSSRTEISDWVNEILKGNRRRKNNLFNALKRWQLDSLS